MLETIRALYLPLIGLLVYLLIWVPVAGTAECFRLIVRLIDRAADSIQRLADWMIAQ